MTITLAGIKSVSRVATSGWRLAIEAGVSRVSSLLPSSHHLRSIVSGTNSCHAIINIIIAFSVRNDITMMQAMMRLVMVMMMLAVVKMEKMVNKVTETSRGRIGMVEIEESWPMSEEFKAILGN